MYGLLRMIAEKDEGFGRSDRKAWSSNAVKGNNLRLRSVDQLS